MEDTIKSQVQDANAALTRKFTEVALGYLDLSSTGGDSRSLLGGDFDVLGLSAPSDPAAAQARCRRTRGGPSSSR